MITIRRIAVETVDAWEVCQKCIGKDGKPHPHLLPDCLHCQGEGGRWHEAVEVWPIGGQAMLNGGWRNGDLYHTKYLDKTSILIREHEVCENCDGEGHDVGGDSTDDCPYCLKDADGKPTRCESGTASAWRVKDDC